LQECAIRHRCFRLKFYLRFIHNFIFLGGLETKIYISLNFSSVGMYKYKRICKLFYLFYREIERGGSTLIYGILINYFVYCNKLFLC